MKEVCSFFEIRDFSSFFYDEVKANPSYVITSEFEMVSEKCQRICM